MVGKAVSIDAIALLLIGVIVSRTVAKNRDALRSVEKIGLAVGFGNQGLGGIG